MEVDRTRHERDTDREGGRDKRAGPRGDDARVEVMATPGESG